MYAIVLQAEADSDEITLNPPGVFKRKLETILSKWESGLFPTELHTYLPIEEVKYHIAKLDVVKPTTPEDEALVAIRNVDSTYMYSDSPSAYRSGRAQCEALQVHLTSIGKPEWIKYIHTSNPDEKRDYYQLLADRNLFAIPPKGLNELVSPMFKNEYDSIPGYMEFRVNLIHYMLTRNNPLKCINNLFEKVGMLDTIRNYVTNVVKYERNINIHTPKSPDLVRDIDGNSERIPYLAVPPWVDATIEELLSDCTWINDLVKIGNEVELDGRHMPRMFNWNLKGGWLGTHQYSTRWRGMELNPQYTMRLYVGAL